METPAADRGDRSTAYDLRSPGGGARPGTDPDHPGGFAPENQVTGTGRPRDPGGFPRVGRCDVLVLKAYGTSSPTLQAKQRPRRLRGGQRADDDCSPERLIIEVRLRFPVIRYLQQARVPYLMPVVCSGLSPQQPGGPTGSYVFRTWKKSGWSHYTLADDKKRTATVSIGVKCRNYRGQWKRHGRQALIHASWGYRPPSPDAVFPTYRLRFGIESSNRQLHEGRIRTTTRRPEVRLLYVGIALVLCKLWVWLHYAVLSQPRRGGRVILRARPAGRRSCSGGST